MPLKKRKFGKSKYLSYLLSFVVFFLALNLFISSEAVSSESPKEETAKKFILDNGLTVIIKKIPLSPVISFEAVVKTGSADEEEFLGSGISHFVEHMLFKGTKKLGVGDIEKKIKSLGGQVNGYTLYDYTACTLTVPRENIEGALNLLADILIHSQFVPKELEKERDVILNEIRLHRDQPDRYAFRLLFSSAFKEHPYQHPIIGYEPLLKNLTRKDLLAYYSRNYIPNNIVIAVAGSLNTAQTLLKIKKAFKSFSMKPYKRRIIPRKSHQLYRRRIEEQYPTALSRLYLGFGSVDIADKDLFALDALAVLLGRGESSPLYLKVLKGKKLVYSIDAYNYTPFDRGLFIISSILKESNIERAIKAIFKEIDKIKKGAVGRQQLEKAKRIAASDYILSRQTPAAIAKDLAVNEALTGDYNFSARYIQGIKSLKKKDISYAARKYLNKRNLTIAVLKPKEKTTQEELTERPEAAGEIEKYELKNGLRILLRKNTAAPSAAITVVFRGGVREETEENNGISNFTSLLLLKGTKSKSAEEIARELQAHGARISSFSGNNSFGLSLEILSQDIKFALEILGDIIKNPAFPPDETAQEKEIILSRINAQKDNLFGYSLKLLKKELFKTHPYGQDKLGSLSSVSNLTRDDVMRFYNKYFLPGNMVIAVFGDINNKEVLSQLKEILGELPPKEVSLAGVVSEPPIEKRREKIKFTDKQQALLAIGVHGVKLSSPDRYSLEVLNAILASSGGRLYSKIREDLGAAYTLGGASVPGVEEGFYYLYAATEKDKLNTVKNIIAEEIERISNEEVSSEELSLAKNYLIGQQKISLQTNDALSFISSLDELYGLGFNDYKLYPERIDAVTKKDIMQAARKYLDLNKAAVLSLMPK